MIINEFTELDFDVNKLLEMDKVSEKKHSVILEVDEVYSLNDVTNSLGFSNNNRFTLGDINIVRSDYDKVYNLQFKKKDEVFSLLALKRSLSKKTDSFKNLKNGRYLELSVFNGKYFDPTLIEVGGS